MSVFKIVPPGGRRLGSLAALILALTGGCDSDTAGVAGESVIPADTTLALADTTTPTAPADSAPAAPADTAPAAEPVDSGTPVPSDPSAPDSTTPVVETASSMAGIVFGTTGLDASQITSVHTGTLRGGGVTESSIGSLLAAVRAKGGRIVLKLCNGSDSYVKNSDGTFSLTKWKALVARFRNSNLGPYISDGTIVGHYLIDEPQHTQRWGGKAISPATLEAMAQYSKSLWPTMPTFVRTLPSWLAASSTTYRYLDAGWAQYVSGKGNVSTYIATEVAAAKKKGLGLMVGLNVLDGGNGSSRIPGTTRGKYAMSASEIRTYATALLGQSYVCGLYNVTYSSSYYGRSDVKSAFADMSAKARAHPKTSCRQ
jgi:hypothetical protein